MRLNSKSSKNHSKTIHYINHHLESAIEIYSTYTQTDISNQLNKDTIEATAKCFTNDLSMSPTTTMIYSCGLKKSMILKTRLTQLYILQINYYSVDIQNKKYTFTLFKR